jgi:hypothetical protein
VNDFSLHLAPNAPWPWLALLSLGVLGLGIWAYRFRIPPMPSVVRRLLSFLRIAVLLLLLWLLAQPVLERAGAGRPARIVVLVDRSASMDLPVAAGSRETRAEAADRAVDALRGAWRSRAQVQVVPFAGRLLGDSSTYGDRSATALGDALGALPASMGDQGLDGVVVVSDGTANAGVDPAGAAQALGVPVHAVPIGGRAAADRSVLEVEAPAHARVGEPTPVRVHVTSDQARGTPIPVRVLDRGHELAQRSVPAPGPGLEAVVEFQIPPARPGLAVWTAQVDSLPGQLTARNDARDVAVEVAPGKLGVLIVSPALNWDLAFLRRAIAGDSSLALDTRVHERTGWIGIESRRAGPPTPGDLRGKAVVVLDGIAASDVSGEFDAALAAYARSGGGLLVMGGSSPGLSRHRGSGQFARAVGIVTQAQPVPRMATPSLTPEGRELLAWDEDPARGEAAWRNAAPLTDPAPVVTAGGDRVLLAAGGTRVPLLFTRHAGRGQALFVNGAGFWRWALTQSDDESDDRARRLWRRIVRWLAEPVQGEPLRVSPERWVTPSGERVHLFASLQDDAFRPVAGATIEGEARNEAGRRIPLAFNAGSAGSYVATVEEAPPGRYTVTARAMRGGRELGRARSEFAVDRWSLEAARVEPDRGTLAAMTAAAGGKVVEEKDAGRWARSISPRALARVPTRSLRLWESPWVFAFAVAALSIEWIWRRRRGLP